MAVLLSVECLTSDFLGSSFLVVSFFGSSFFGVTGVSNLKKSSLYSKIALEIASANLFFLSV